MQLFLDRIVNVTGAGSGIGNPTARRFLSRWRKSGSGRRQTRDGQPFMR